MTEQQKCNAGLTYRFDDPEMVARKTRAIRECERFNAIDGTDYAAQYEQLKRMPGVTIGDNVVIGAGSVVTKSILANSLAVGVPARIIRQF